MELFHKILVLVVLVFILISLYREWFGTAFTFVIAIVIFGLSGLLSPKEMISGFANEQLVIILILLLLGDSIRKTGILENTITRLFSKAETTNGFLLRMMLFVSSFSAFFNNTPLVVLLMPHVNSWSKRTGVSPSKLLIPLSYAAILGGCATLIGTSTNLIVNSLVVEQTIVPNMEELHIFDYTLIGLPMILIGIAYMLLIGKNLLPDKKNEVTRFDNTHREYLVETEIKQGSKLHGKNIEEAKLGNLPEFFLTEIYRGETKLDVNETSTVLYAHDILIFSGSTEAIADMINEDSGLRLTQVGMFSKKDHTEIREIVVSYNSSLIGKTIRETKFRGQYDSVIIAVHRNGQRISGKIGLVKLEAGDVILLLAGNDFAGLIIDTMDFYPITMVRNIQRIPNWKAIAILGGVIVAILLSAFQLVSLFVSLCILLVMTILLGIVKARDLPKNVDYNLAVIVAFSLAFGTAMTKSGVAEMIAQFVVGVIQPLGVVGLMFGLFVITNLLSGYITNKAAVAIIFPIAVTIAVDMGLDPKPFILLISFAAAASFITPIGYQTNLMVYGPGLYKFKDYMRVGLPLTIIYMIVAVFILAITYNLI